MQAGGGSCSHFLSIEADQRAGECEMPSLWSSSLSTSIWPPCSWNNAVHDREPEPGPIILGRKKWIEDMGKVLRRDAFSIVSNSNAQYFARVDRLRWTGSWLRPIHRAISHFSDHR